MKKRKTITLGEAFPDFFEQVAQEKPQAKLVLLYLIHNEAEAIADFFHLPDKESPNFGGHSTIVSVIQNSQRLGSSRKLNPRGLEPLVSLFDEKDAFVFVIRVKE